LAVALKYASTDLGVELLFNLNFDRFELFMFLNVQLSLLNFEVISLLLIQLTIKPERFTVNSRCLLDYARGLALYLF
jgi:hypothetical protein